MKRSGSKSRSARQDMGSPVRHRNSSSPDSTQSVSSSRSSFEIESESFLGHGHPYRNKTSGGCNRLRSIGIAVACIAVVVYTTKLVYGPSSRLEELPESKPKSLDTVIPNSILNLTLQTSDGNPKQCTYSVLFYCLSIQQLVLEFYGSLAAVLIIVILFFVFVFEISWQAEFGWRPRHSHPILA